MRVTNSCGRAEASAWVGEMPVGEEYLAEQEPDLPAWCNKVPAHLPGAIRYLPTCLVQSGTCLPAWCNNVPAYLPGEIRYLPSEIRYLPTFLVQ